MNITKYGRGLYLVQSRSRPDKDHWVDFEGCPDGFDLAGGNDTLWHFPEVALDPVFCTCEAFLFHKNRPCGHIKAAIQLYLLDQRVDPAFRRLIMREFNKCGDIYNSTKLAYQAWVAEKCQPTSQPRPKRQYRLKS